jgi:predicted TIM-barrel fold metal-dependent hydrolase
MTLIDRHPDVRFIIDHLGILQPRVPPAPPQPWASLSKVLELARRPNAVIKISGACTLSREPYPFPDICDRARDGLTIASHGIASRLVPTRRRPWPNAGYCG